MSRLDSEVVETLPKSARDAKAVVRGPSGQLVSLGKFLQDRQKASGLPVTRLVDAANVSRANYYLLLRDEQKPQIQMLVAILAALGVETSVPPPEAEEQHDLVAFVDGERYSIDLGLSRQQQKRSRARYWSAARRGLEVAAAAAAISRGPAVAGVPLPRGPFVVAVAVAALAAASRRELHVDAEHRAPRQQEFGLRRLLHAEIDKLSVEKLEALLVATYGLSKPLSSHEELQSILMLYAAGVTFDQPDDAGETGAEQSSA